MKVDILILNYNGKDMMASFLPSICAAAGRSSNECGVHVVDNQSTDGSVDMLKEQFPGVSLHVAGENRVLCSYNDVVAGLDSDIVIFLNNDMKVEPDFVDPLVTHFENPRVMFAAPRIINFDGTYNGGRSFIKLEYGAIKVMVDFPNEKTPGQTQAISTGAFRRSAFLDYGGFDDLYLPGIWEDVDICYRGLLTGWKGIYEPSSVIWHDESTTFHKKYGRKGKMRIAHRNMFLFFWKNITDGKLFLRHIIFTLPRGILKYITGDTEILEGFFMALKILPEVKNKRREMREERKKYVLSDRDLIR